MLAKRRESAWRREFRTHERVLGKPPAATTRTDWHLRPCVFCPPTPPVARPCFLCRDEEHAIRESPVGSLVNDQPVCAKHRHAVLTIRADIAHERQHPGSRERREVAARLAEVEAMNATVAAYYARNLHLTRAV